MYLKNIAISNYHTFTYHPQLQLDKGMEFDTDPYTSNVNILIGPNGSGKSNFLVLLTLLCNIHSGVSSSHNSSDLIRPHTVKKHPGFESYPSKIIAQRVIGGASEDHSITMAYDLDTLTYQIVDGSEDKSGSFNYCMIDIHRSLKMQEWSDLTIGLAREHLGIMYNPLNQSYITASGALRTRDDLGSGEQSLWWMIHTICNPKHIAGLVLVDEPELHLHPQYQTSLGQILEILSQRCNIQIIIATHSPTFINEHNIINVFRFDLSQGHTHMINPVTFQGQEQAKIKQILTDSNMSKLFFAQRIVMVEGDTDEYFLHRYIKHYTSTHRLQAWRHPYELLNIAGKSSLGAWRKFCDQFHIQWSFIGDWDNVINSQFGTEIETIKRRIPRNLHGHKLTKSQQYSLLIQEISNRHIALEQRISIWIDKQQDHHSFTLRHGDLEAYLGLQDKGLAETIQWCTSQFESWLIDPAYQQYRNDINHILNKIFHVKSD